MNSVIGPEGSRPAPKHFVNGRNRIILSLLFIAVLIATVSFTVNARFFVHAQSASSPLATPAQLDQLNQQLAGRLRIVGQKSNALAPAALPAYNNASTTNDNAPTQANFDGAGRSYSAQGLALAGLTPNKTFVYDGISFVWPNSPVGKANNYVALGQVLPLNPIANPTILGFVGAASNGQSAGNAVITYTDNTTQTFSLGMSDWTQVNPAYGNHAVASITYRNLKTGRQSIKTFLFYAHVGVDPAKVVQSVKLPTNAGRGQLHIFAVGVRSGYTNIYNNSGMSDDANPGPANFDGGGSSYSLTSVISNSGGLLAPGNTVQYNGMNLTMPDALGGSPDNFLAQGQTVKIASPVTGAVRIGIVGSATNGPSCGTAFINYVGGNTQSFSLCLSDWTLNALHNPASYGNTPLGVETHLNSHSGSRNVYTFLFYTEVRVDPTQTVSSITLPSATTRGQLHVFTLGASAIEVDNNVGARHDNGTTYGTNLFADIDGQYNAYSIEALHAAGMSQPDQNGLMHFKFNGVNFITADSYSDYPDNTVGLGQTIAYPSLTATRLAFLGAATNGPQVGTATINYTDGTKQTFQLGFNDWASPSPLRYGNTIAMTMQYRNGLQGKHGPKVYMYYMQVTLTAGKTVASLTLPSNKSMHIFGFSAA
ncbi:MAG: hypothetical protein H0V70_20755 [Ktedonobacteraceae bacterium]|nr:hypothetical protein [Ktedonobacteraceae bacterium]